MNIDNGNHIVYLNYSLQVKYLILYVGEYWAASQLKSRIPLDKQVQERMIQDR